MKKMIALLLLISNFAVASDLEITNAVVRLVPPVSKTTALFCKITNKSKKEINLTKITGNLSDMIEIHEMKMENGKMEMRPVDKLKIPAGAEVALKSGSYHAMVMNMKKPLKLGGIELFTLYFDNKETVEVQAMVLEI